MTMTSGSWRTMCFSVSAYETLIFGLIEHCEMPSIMYSTGSSAVMMLVLASFR